MANKKLQEIGNELGVSKRDMARIRRQRLKGKLLYPIIGAAIVACSSGLGFLVGKTVHTSGGGYPYAATGLALTADPKIKHGGLILVTVLLSVIGFLVAHSAGSDGYHAEALYNVFPRQK